MAPTGTGGDGWLRAQIAELGASDPDKRQSAPVVGEREPLGRVARNAHAEGLEATRVEAPLRTALALVSPRRALFAAAADGTLLRLRPRRSLVRVEDEAGRGHWASVSALARALGAEREGTELPFCVVHRGLLAPTEREEVEEPPPPLERTRAFLGLERQDLGVLAVHAVGIGLLSVGVPIAVQALVGFVAFGALLQPVFVLALLVFAVLAFAATLRAMQLRVVEALNRRTLARVVVVFARRLSRAHLGTYHRRDVPELVNRFFDVFTVQKSVASLAVEGLDAVLVALAGMLVLAFYHPWLLVFDVALIVATVALARGLGRGGIASGIAESRAKYAVAAWLEEVAKHPLLFRSARGEAVALARAEDLATTYLAEREGHFRVVYRQAVGALGVQVVASVALLAMGGALVVAGQLTLGQLVAGELIVTAVVASVSKAASKVESFYDLVAAVDELGEVFDLPAEAEDGAVAELPATHGPVVLEAPELGVGALGAHPGERILIVDRDDGAASEWAAAFVDPRSSPHVLRLDGVDARDLPRTALRAQVAVVRAQDLLPGTLEDQLRAGGAGLEAPDLYELLGRVGLEARVRSLEAGLRTTIGPGGQPLHRHEQVALSIARALATKPAVVVVDRALDALTEGHRHALLDRMGVERGVVWVLISAASDLLERCEHQLLPRAREHAPAAEARP